MGDAFRGERIQLRPGAHSEVNAFALGVPCRAIARYWRAAATIQRLHLVQWKGFCRVERVGSLESLKFLVGEWKGRALAGGAERS